MVGVKSRACNSSCLRLNAPGRQRKDARGGGVGVPNHAAAQSETTRQRIGSPSVSLVKQGLSSRLCRRCDTTPSVDAMLLATYRTTQPTQTRQSTRNTVSAGSGVQTCAISYSFDTDEMVCMRRYARIGMQQR